MPTLEILPRLKNSFGTSRGGKIRELLRKILEQPDLGLQPFMGIPLPYGVGTLDLEDLKVSFLSNPTILTM